ncbi:VanZ family protein [Variovorax sp. RHLX14]|uniref:VanZ family protein n=1 Tax=Variovorax sp. RHLX14 TaxID=1259731 RepID=UPI003F4809AB
MTRNPKLTLWRLALAICMAAITVLSLLPLSQPLPSTGWDKSNHMLGFSALAFLSHWAWPGRTVKALVVLLVYGCLIEVLQSFTPDRSADLADVVADGVGLAIGAGIARVLAVLAKLES